jgi:general secretion pathway protein C|tara:strand:+ start:490 stop:1359 length:870 start_codon:yes stop_codon:yes gene_type:complete
MQLHILIEKLVNPTQWLIAFAIAWTIANSVIGLLAAPSSSTSDSKDAISTDTAGQSQLKSNERKDKTKRVEALINRHVFGLVPQTNNGQARSIETAKATRLPLTLEAVFVANDNASSGAIVARSGKKGVLYAVSDILPGNARLIEVQQEQIILQRAGNREALAFGKSKFNPKAEIGAKRSVQAAKPNRNIQSVDDIQGLIRENVESALKDFGLETNEGRGYKIGNLSSNPYLQQAGLRPGDIVLSVNGQPLGDLQKDQLEFDNILAQGSASIELERNGEQMSITARLPN